MRATNFLASATIALLGTVAVAANEVLIVKELNLRQKEVNRIVDIARDGLANRRKILSVNAYKIRGGPKEALVTFEPRDLDESSFRTTKVLCQKKKRVWTCEKPNSSKYYYEKTLSNSIALGEGVTVKVARELLIAARGSSSTFVGVIDGRYLQLGGYSFITQNSENEYVIHGWCDCVLERTTEGFSVARYLDVI